MQRIQAWASRNYGHQHFLRAPQGMHLYISHSAKADPGSSSGAWDHEESSTPWSPVSHPGLDVSGREDHSPASAPLLGLALQIHMLWRTTLPMLCALGQPRSLFSHSVTSCDTLKPLLDAPQCVRDLPGCVLSVLPGEGGTAGQGRAPTAPLPRHRGMGGGVVALAKAVEGEGLPVVLEILWKPKTALPNTQSPRRAVRPYRGRKDSWTPQGCAAPPRPAGEGWRGLARTQVMNCRGQSCADV